MTLISIDGMVPAHILAAMRRLSALCAITLAFVVACGPQSVSSAKRAQSVEAQVWSPYCPGRLLIDCTTHQARELRADIRERVEGGDSNDKVLAWVRENYGEEALAEPPGSGIGLIIWLGPLVLIAGGAIVLIVLLRRWSRTTPAHQQGGTNAGS
jgi:cytochrome c-type biogenesis protein CcmH